MTADLPDKVAPAPTVDAAPKQVDQSHESESSHSAEDPWRLAASDSYAKESLGLKNAADAMLNAPDMKQLGFPSADFFDSSKAQADTKHAAAPTKLVSTPEHKESQASEKHASARVEHGGAAPPAKEV